MMSLSHGGLRQLLSPLWRRLLGRWPMLCPLWHLSCRGGTQSFLETKDRLEIGFKRATVTPIGEQCRTSEEKDLAKKDDRVTALNAVSLFWGVAGNIFLLLNFTQTVRYIIALPATIVSWFLATGIVSDQACQLCAIANLSISSVGLPHPWPSTVHLLDQRMYTLRRIGVLSSQHHSTSSLAFS